MGCLTLTGNPGLCGQLPTQLPCIGVAGTNLGRMGECSGPVPTRHAARAARMLRMCGRRAAVCAGQCVAVLVPEPDAICVGPRPAGKTCGVPSVPILDAPPCRNDSLAQAFCTGYYAPVPAPPYSPSAVWWQPQAPEVAVRLQAHMSAPPLPGRKLARP